MEKVKKLLEFILLNIVDQPDQINIEVTENEKRLLISNKSSKRRCRKSYWETRQGCFFYKNNCKAAGAKNGCRVMLNVFNKPLE